MKYQASSRRIVVCKRRGHYLRILIPVVDESGLDAQIFNHFGKAPFFSLIDLDERGQVIMLKTVKNSDQHFGGGGKRAGFILSHNPDVIIAYGMGPRGIKIYQSKNVAVLGSNAKTVKEAIEAYRKGELVELTEGCQQAQHP